MKYLLIATLLFVFGCSHLARRPSSESLQSYSAQDRAVYQKLLHDSLSFFNQVLRDPHSGQYFDAISLNPKDSPDYNSSVAATGMGLISLALGDATGTIPQAREQAIQSLTYVQGLAKLNGKTYLSLRSPQGWFRHWFDSRDGSNNKASLADGFSTIDTAILVAGAEMAANYFAATGQDPDGRIRALADRILFSVQWGSAVADLQTGRIYLNYDIHQGKALGSTAVFNEYLLVACMGKYAEERAQKPGAMTQFWKAHYGAPQTILRKDYEGLPLMTDHPAHYLSDFTVQFVNYLCADANHSPDYLTNMENVRKADQAWFAKQGAGSSIWGLGAGEFRFRDDKGQIQSGYHADSLEDNPHNIVSPHIIAGFLSIYPQGLNDLLTLYRNQQGLHHYNDYDLLWRFSLKDPDLSIDRLQAIDYSSTFLGLSSLHPNVGLEFFQKYAPGSR
jgi:hypothetical protein